MKKTLSLVMISSIALSMLSILPLYVRASLPVHNLDTGLVYATIQEAIDVPETLDGHTILVDAGTYYEHAVVHKSLSLVGEDRSTTVIDGSGTGNVVTITANEVTITDFKIQNSGPSHPLRESGIYIDHSSGNSISHNIITNNNHGILGYSSSNNDIFGNNVAANNYHGIFLFDYSSYNTICGNTITSNIIGIKLRTYSNYNIVSGNIISEHTEGGVELDICADNNTISGNRIADNIDWGIRFWDSSFNNVSQNTVMNNSPYGIWVEAGSSCNRFYHNDFIGNAHQALPDPSDYNIWDNGYPSGGNYWSDQYHGDCADHYSGPGQDIPGSDGIVDTPYFMDANNQDNYPLMESHPIIEATLDIDPDTLNLKSNGQWITAYIELPEGYCASEIDVSSILLNGSVSVDPEAPTEVGDYDVDSIPDLMVKFERAVVMEWLGTVDYGEDTGKTVEVTVVITGEAAGTPFEDIDTIRVLLEG